MRNHRLFLLSDSIPLEQCQTWEKCDTDTSEICLATTMPNLKQIC